MVKTLAVGLLLMQICSVVQGIVTSCEDVSVYLGDPANITCVFSEDINQTRSGDFRVYRYDLYSRTEKEVLVLDCYWSDKAICQTTEGYTFDKTVSNRLTVGISHANETHEGRYECQVQPTDPANVNQCRLTLKAGVKPTPPPGPTTSATLTTEAANQDEEGGTNAAAIVVPIILVLIILVCAGLAYKCREKIFKRFPGIRLVNPASAAEEGHTTVALLNQHVRQSKNDPLQHNQQPIPQSEERESSGVNPVVNEESDAEEGDEEFVIAPEPQNDSDMHFAHKGAASGDKTFTQTSGIKSTAQQPAVDTEKYEHENSSKASSRDSKGSYNQTSVMKTEITTAQESPEILRPMTSNNTENERTPPDTENKVCSWPLKHPIQASDDAEINERKDAEVNIQETLTAAAPDEAVVDSNNTDKPAALAKDKFEQKGERYGTTTSQMNVEKDTSSKPGGKDKDCGQSDDDGDIDDDDDDGASGADDNSNTNEPIALLKEQSKGKDEKNATAEADTIKQFDKLMEFPDAKREETNESNSEDKKRFKLQ